MTHLPARIHQNGRKEECIHPGIEKRSRICSAARIAEVHFSAEYKDEEEQDGNKDKIEL